MGRPIHDQRPKIIGQDHREIFKGTHREIIGGEYRAINKLNLIQIKKSAITFNCRLFIYH